MNLLRSRDAGSYRRKGAQNFDPVLGCERVWGVEGGEVGQSSGRVCWCPAQDVTQLWRVGINGVPSHQKLQERNRIRIPEKKAMNSVCFVQIT